MNTIEIDHLTKTYGQSARGVCDLSFQVPQGEIFGFIGPNGAGKSTTIRVLLGLLHPTSGSARLFGQDTRNKSEQLRTQIGYVPSEVNYYDDLTVGKLL